MPSRARCALRYALSDGAPPRPSSASRVLRVGEELDAVALEERRLRRQRAGLLVLGGQRARRDLAGLDVGLVERVDAHHRAGDGRRDLPADELLGRGRICSATRMRHDRLARLLQRRDGGVLRGVGRRPRDAGRRTRDRRRSADGAPTASRSTGMMPLPSLPVDSAMSCSSQAPRSWMPGDAMSVSLSTPCGGRHAEDRAEHERRGSPPRARPARRRAPCARPRRAAARRRGPSTAAGTMPKFESAE